MVTISRFTGKIIDDYNHTIESIYTLLTTPKATRVYRRAFGFDVFGILDKGITDSMKLKIFQGTAELAKEEKRFKLESTEMNTDNAHENEIAINVYGLYLPDNKPIKLEGIKIA